VSKKSQSSKSRPFYKSPPPKPKGVASALRADSIEPQARHYNVSPTPNYEFRHPHLISAAPFELREDGSIGAPNSCSARSETPPQRADPDQPSLSSSGAAGENEDEEDGNSDIRCSCLSFPVTRHVSRVTFKMS
jgi:hypothetical protein